MDSLRAANRPTLLTRTLAYVERAGNALPHPATLFALMALAVIVVSAVAARFDVAHDLERAERIDERPPRQLVDAARTSPRSCGRGTRISPPSTRRW